MGFISIGNVFKGITSGLGSIAKTALQAVAPKVTDMLKGIVGDLFSQGTKALQGVVSNLPGPLGDIASKLVGKGGDALSKLGQDALGKLIEGLVNKIAPRDVAGAPAGTQTTTPSVATAAGTAARSAATSAATAALQTVAPQSPVNTSGLSSEDAAANQAAALKEPARPPDGASEGEMIKYQEQLQKYARMMDMLSKIIQAKNDMQKGIISNFRV
jgi:hypothetical protein